MQAPDDNVVPLKTEPDHVVLARENMQRQQQLRIELNPLEVIMARLDMLTQRVLNRGQLEVFELEFQQMISENLDNAEREINRAKLLAGTPAAGQLAGQLSIDDALKDPAPDIAGRDL